MNMKTNSTLSYFRDKSVLITGASSGIAEELPWQLAQARGNLALIGSGSGWVSPPGASPYCMSKFAVRALANSIAPELRRAGIKLTLISPGFIASNIRRVDNRGTVHPDAADPVPAWIQMPTPQAARQILLAVARGQREQIITLHAQVFVAIAIFLS